MELRSSDTRRYARMRPVNFCAQCGETLFVPEWSEHVDERRLRHLWACDACGYAFETLVCFPASRRG